MSFDCPALYADPCRCNGCTGSVSFRITRLSDERSFRASGRFRIDETFFKRRRLGNGRWRDGKGKQEPAGSLLSRCRIEEEAERNALWKSRLSARFRQEEVEGLTEDSFPGRDRIGQRNPYNPSQGCLTPPKGECHVNGTVSGCPESETATADRGGRVFLLRAICLISGELPFLFLEKQMEVWYTN